MSEQHISEPWVLISGGEGNTFISNAADTHWSAPEHFVCVAMTPNARRIVAAVNACAGIPTDSLEAGVVAEMVEALTEAEDWLACHAADDSDPGVTGLIAQIRAALAKARGEDQSPDTHR